VCCHVNPSVYIEIILVPSLAYLALVCCLLLVMLDLGGTGFLPRIIAGLSCSNPGMYFVSVVVLFFGVWVLATDDFGSYECAWKFLFCTFYFPILACFSILHRLLIFCDLWIPPLTQNQHHFLAQAYMFRAKSLSTMAFTSHIFPFYLLVVMESVLW